MYPQLQTIWKELESFDISANRIDNVKGLEKLDKIVDLDLSDNQISDYTGLGEYIAEKYAKVYGKEHPEGSIKFLGQTVVLGEKNNCRKWVGRN